MPTRYNILLAWKTYSQLDFRGYKSERELEKAASKAIPVKLLFICTGRTNYLVKWLFYGRFQKA